MRKFRACLGIAVGAISFLALSGVAQAAEIDVGPGQSIQAAVGRAQPGDTIEIAPGVYHQHVILTKNGIHLVGTPGRTILTAGPGQTAGPCGSPDAPGQVMGICILGHFTKTGPGTPVSGDSVWGITVTGFGGFGVLLLNASDITVSNTVAHDNKSYGISGFILSHVSYLHNVSYNNGEPGFYIGDSVNAAARVIDNLSYNNGLGGVEGFGFLFRDSSFGVVQGNKAWGNCAGMAFADTGEDPLPDQGWWVSGNTLTANNRACAGASGGPPPVSGIGAVLLGTHHVTLSENTITGNHATGPTLAAGGIVVASSKSIGGADPTANVIVDNTVFHNSPFDILWDGSGSGNSFPNNDCGTSKPAWIC